MEREPSVLPIDPRFPYPRRPALRFALRQLSRLAFTLLTDLRIHGQENVPKSGPLLVVANHFSYIDPVAMVRAIPFPIEFVGGFRMPFAPKGVTWIPKIWGYYPVHRGSASRDAMRAAEAVLRQSGVLGIFPEAGSWAEVLRPPRPGAAFLAVRTSARVLPLGLDGLVDVFPGLRKGQRARVTVRIGEPFGPFRPSGKGRVPREQLDDVGHDIMRQISELIPLERRGHYSADAAIRAAAQDAAAYPWANTPEA